MIKVIKLITGEELVADVTIDAEGQANLSKPAALQLMPSRTDPQQIMVALMPYAQYTKSHAIEVHMENILWMEEPVDELYNQYNSIFGSGLQLV
jgi:hypothetical protein